MTLTPGTERNDNDRKHRSRKGKRLVFLWDQWRSGNNSLPHPVRDGPRRKSRNDAGVGRNGSGEVGDRERTTKDTLISLS